MYDEKKNLLSGGAFMGNTLYNDNNNVKTHQLINPIFFNVAEKVGNINKGTFILHEITESYEGGLKSLEYKKEAEKKIEGEYNEIYDFAHSMATYQPVIERYFYDYKNKLIKKSDEEIIPIYYIRYYIKGKLMLEYIPSKSKKKWSK